MPQTAGLPASRGRSRPQPRLADTTRPISALRAEIAETRLRVSETPSDNNAVPCDLLAYTSGIPLVLLAYAIPETPGDSSRSASLPSNLKAGPSWGRGAHTPHSVYHTHFVVKCAQATSWPAEYSVQELALDNKMPVVMGCVEVSTFSRLSRKESHMTPNPQSIADRLLQAGFGMVSGPASAAIAARLKGRRPPLSKILNATLRAIKAEEVKPIGIGSFTCLE